MAGARLTEHAAKSKLRQVPSKATEAIRRTVSDREPVCRATARQLQSTKSGARDHVVPVFFCFSLDNAFVVDRPE